MVCLKLFLDHAPFLIKMMKYFAAKFKDILWLRMIYPLQCNKRFKSELETFGSSYRPMPLFGYTVKTPSEFSTSSKA